MRFTPLELRHLTSFIAVAERKSFVHAAEHLHLSQPAVTAQIQRLEEELGVQLLDRNRRSVRLTPAGETFLTGARATLESANDAILATQRVARGETGRVRIGFPPSVLKEIMPNIMIEFHKQHPGIKLDLFSLHTSLTIAALEEDNIDIGYVRLPVEAKGLRITPVHHEPLVVCLPRGHRLAARTHVRMEDLREERFILYERKWAPGFHDHFLALCSEAGFQPVVAQQIDEMYLAATLVATGVGIAIIPRMVLSLPNDSIVVKPIVGSSEPALSELGIATRSGEPSPVIRSIISISCAIGKRHSALEVA